MPNPMPTAVEVAGLVVAYGDVVAVDGVDLTVGAGEVVALLGRNGAGKTSTVETLEGYRKARSGSVRVLGLDPGTSAGQRRLSAKVGVMLQRGGVYPGMNPAEVLRLFSCYYESPIPPSELLTRLDLTAVATTPWRRLSGGEQQRLSLALALVGRPEVVFLDEPTAGVDPHGRSAIRGEIEGLRDGGVGVLLTTHELEEAERVADRIVIIESGRVVADGSLTELTSAGPSGGATKFGSRTGLDVASASKAVGAPVIEESPGHYAINAPASPSMIAALTAWLAGLDVGLTELRTGNESLEDVFLRLTARPDE